MQQEKEFLICKACNKKSLEVFIDFGKMPVSNAYHTKEEIASGKEYIWNMAVGFCHDCYMVQLTEFVPYDKYIIKNSKGKTEYAFHSSLSNAMIQHFKEFAEEMQNRFLSKGDKVAEIGGNDGIMLQSYSKDFKTLNIEPSSNVAEEAKTRGIETIVDFFTQKLAEEVVTKYGKFKVITSSNVILNIHDINEVASGVKIMLSEKGVFVMQDPYMGQILEDVAYDQIYDEHVWYPSLNSLENLFNRYGMEVFDAKLHPVHGGSMRVFIARKGDYEKTKDCKDYFNKEKERKMNTIEAYSKFAKKTKESNNNLKDLLKELKSKGKKIVGYAAASKGTVILNYAGIGPDVIDYVVDSTPDKQGKYIPGVHIPIVSPEKFKHPYPDYALLGARNHAKEISNKETDFLKMGGRFIMPLPNPRVLESGIVKVKKLNSFFDEEGELFETLRCDDEIFSGVFGQNLISIVKPGIIKGLHFHRKQTEYTTCIKGNILYVAIKEVNGQDLIIEKFEVGERNRILIKTEPGIWHGYTPLDGREAVVLYTMDKAYNHKDPDTEDKDPFAFGDIWEK